MGLFKNPFCVRLTLLLEFPGLLKSDLGPSPLRWIRSATKRWTLHSRGGTFVRFSDESGCSPVSRKWTKVDTRPFLSLQILLVLLCFVIPPLFSTLLYRIYIILEEYSTLVSRCTEHSVVCVVLFPNSMRIWRGGTICGNGRKDEGIAFHPTVRTLNTVSAPTALGRGSVLSPLGTPTTILDAHCFTHF